jgi:ferric-dicitrate binding protein FerR (iron transport regulator)
MPYKSKGRLYWLSGIAASLIFGTLCLFFYLKKPDKSIYQQLITSNTAALTEQYNNTGNPVIIKLDDGSYVTLQNKSRLSFPKTFKNKNNREVYLNGAAFFSIAKNPKKPFLVYANGIVTKVLGTKFKVNSFDTDKKTVVEVISGIVSVNSFNLKNAKPEKNNNKDSGVILTRNQKAIYGTDSRQLEASIIENPMLADSTINLHFNDTSIKQVLTSIKQLYGIGIIYDEKMVTGKTITADLTNTTMYQKLDVICKILNCHYEIIDRNIYINQEH